MPSLLEQVQPSWLTDGLGVQGQQTDINLDDDSSWDTTAWSRNEQNQEDFIAKCCTGACCHPDGSCDIQSQSNCTTGGGAYQGDGTRCEDVDCTHTGACCVGETCSITRAADCLGTYQGDGTTCDPNPCALPACNGCGFDACDGSGRKFLTRTETKHIVKIQSCLNSDPTLTCERGTDATYIFHDHFEADCSLTSSVELLGDANFIGGFYEETYHNCNGTIIHDSAPSCGLVCISATEEHCTLETDFHHPTCTPVDTSLITTIDVVLSDECMP